MNEYLEQFGTNVYLDAYVGPDNLCEARKIIHIIGANARVFYGKGATPEEAFEQLKYELEQNGQTN